MRDKITRSIVESTVESAIVRFEKGLPVAVLNEPLTFNGIIKEDRALKEVRKVYGATAQVTEVKTVNETYEISVDDFIKYATKIQTTDSEGGEASGN